MRSVLRPWSLLITVALAAAAAHAGTLRGTLGIDTTHDPRAVGYSLSLVDENDRAVETTYPDADGAFVFDAEPGRYRLRIIAEMPYRTRQYFPVVITDAETTLDPKLALAPEVTVSIRDEHGVPIPNATVQTTSYVGQDSATTGADGHATIRLGVPEGMDVHVSARGYLPAIVEVGTGGIPGITLWRGGSVAGRFTTLDKPYGTPVRVCFMTPGQSPTFVKGALDVNGRFSIEGIPEGTGRLGVLVDGVTTIVVDEMVMEKGVERDLGTLDGAPGSSLEFVVTDPSGTPIAEANVLLTFDVWSFFQWNRTTDARGRAVFGGLPAGNYTVSANAPGGWLRTEDPHVVITAGQPGAPYPIICNRAIELTGRAAVEDGVVPPWQMTDSALVSAVITAQSTDRPVREEWQGTIGPDGSIRAAQCRPGGWNIYIVAGEWRGLLRDVTIPEPGMIGESHDIGDITMTAPRQNRTP